MSAQAITDDQFEAEVLQSDKPVVVDFWAEWCGPCKAFAPTLDEYASEAGDKVKVLKMNVEESPNAPTQFGVRAIPTIMVFKDGEVVAQHAGAMQKSDLSDWVDGAI